MAVSDLRSSPARPTLHDRLTMLSSSPFPDIQDLIAKKPKTSTLRSGSAAAPIPANLRTDFTSASDLLRTARATGNDAFDIIDEPEPPPKQEAPAKRVRKAAPKAKVEPKPSKAPKRAAKDVIVLSSDGATPEVARHEDLTAAVARLGKDGAREDNDLEGTPLKAKPWKKYKLSPSAGPTGFEETEMSEAARPPANTKPQRKKSKPETTSRHFANKDGTSEKAIPKEKKQKRSRISTPEPINLEPAVQRRRDWTPPRQDSTDAAPEAELPKPMGQHCIAEHDGTGTDVTDLFRNLRDAFGHKMGEEKPPAPQQQPAKVLGKRKVVDMVSINQQSKSAAADQVPPPVEKAPKKKPRTITELSTAAYAPKAVESDDHPGEESVLDYFQVGVADQDVSKTATSKGKGKAKANKGKKVPPKKPVLLSPRAALKRSAAQDFVFGTSSQLAREQSPTLLKDLHEALKASTIAEEKNPFASSSEASKTERPSKGLWSVSARDEDGEMVNVEIIDLADSPAFPEDDAILDPWTQLTPEPTAAGPETADASVVEIGGKCVATGEDKSSQPPVPKSHFFTTQRKITVNAAAAQSPLASNESFPLITELLEHEMPPPSNQEQIQEDIDKSPSKAVPSPQKPRPKYELFTDVRLAKEISKFGFKTVKTRNAMISLLDQCWKSKNQPLGSAAAFSTRSMVASPKRKQPTSPQGDSVASPPAKKPRGRPKNTATADAAETEAITKAPPRKKVTAAKKSVIPNKKPGRARKDTTGGAAAGEESSAIPPLPKARPGPSTPKRKKAATQPAGVLDSNFESEPEVGLSSPEQLFSPENADVSIGEDTDVSLNLGPSDELSLLFSQITKAVTSAPRTTDPENPSWHEKMLMYDPIILEDLTAWLNSGPLTKAGHDDEVAPQDVKKWCESRSICCLGRVNLRGKERKRL